MHHEFYGATTSIPWAQFTGIKAARSLQPAYQFTSSDTSGFLVARIAFTREQWRRIQEQVSNR